MDCIRIVLTLFAVTLPAICGDWSPQRAAEYLDARQKAWFAWPAANKDASGPCLSCHTGLSYLLARAELNRALGEDEPTLYQAGLIDGIRKRLSRKTPQEFLPGRPEAIAARELGVESVLSALLLSFDNAGAKYREQAFERMWSQQISNGESKGAWKWNSFDLDPWEEPDSVFYGATLAALAAGPYQTPRFASNVASLKSYLAARQQSQPLHNRLFLLWASTTMPDVLSHAERDAIIAEALRRQEKDGGWRLQALGSWSKHEQAPPSTGCDGYATGLAAFVLQKAGMARNDPRLQAALAWLRTHQDPSGFWDSTSLNKKYDPASMPAKFMRDSATAFAVLALLESGDATTAP